MIKSKSKLNKKMPKKQKNLLWMTHGKIMSM